MIRLSKYLQQSGIGSRRQAEELISASKVKINDRTITEPFTRVMKGDKVTVSGKLIHGETTLCYYIVNKPKGMENILTLFSDVKVRLFTIGRFDVESEGLVIVTNDGNFALKVSDPLSKIDKEYIVTVDKPLTDDHLKIISMGQEIDGLFVPPIKVEIVEPQTLHIVIEEGKRREIRYLLSDTGLSATTIKRVRIGPLYLDDLPTGRFIPFDPTCFDCFGA